MKNDYLFAIMKRSGLYHIDKQGRVWTCKQMGGPTHIKGPWRRAEIVSGTRQRLQVRHNQKLVYASRFVWFWFNGTIPKGCEIDHEDNNNQNNRLENLTPLTRLQNQQKAERDGLIVRTFSKKTRRKMSVSITQWWASPGVRERVSEAIKRGKRRQHYG